MRKIAITGFLSAGKSSVSAIFRQYGAYTINADDLVHELISSNIEIKKKIVELLGHEILQDGTPSRKKIAELVFANPTKLTALENIIHPEVKNKIISSYESIKLKSYSFFVAEIPLLYSIGMQQWFDYVIGVIADIDIRLSRFLLKGFSQEQFIQRNKALEVHDKAIIHADFIIENNQNLDVLHHQVKNIINQIKEKSCP
ncbi:MAG: dephospho-CoA kinase [Chlamydiales bacterium]|nr:dephospho-CoA kinase [Chlamydiales bacterium]